MYLDGTMVARAADVVANLKASEKSVRLCALKQVGIAHTAQNICFCYCYNAYLLFPHTAWVMGVHGPAVLF